MSWVNIARWLSVFLFVVSLPILLTTSNLRWAVNEIRLYKYGFDKYEVALETGLGRDELLGVARELIKYFNSTEEPVQISLFSDRAVAHLGDVKGLIQLCYTLQWASLAYVVSYIGLSFVWWRGGAWRNLARRFLWGSLATIALWALIGIVAAVGFDRLFLWFHQVCFSNQLWLLPPQDYLLRMFPAGFFLDATLFWAGATVTEAVVIGSIAGGYLVATRKRASGG